LEYTVTIAGKTSTLKYPFSTRREIEKRTEKGLFEACFSGLVEDMLVILWAGLKHDQKGNKGLTVEILEKQLESHVDQTGETVEKILLAGVEAALMSKLVKVNEEQVSLLLAKIRNGDEGKE
jgi:hypothetical protein